MSITREKVLCPKEFGNFFVRCLKMSSVGFIRSAKASTYVNFSSPNKQSYKLGLFVVLKLAMVNFSVAILTYATQTLALHKLTLVC